MEKARVSDEWVIGATLGAYVFLTFVLYFWGSAFVHNWCGNSPYLSFTSDGRFPPYLGFLVPGTIVGVLDWAQVKAAHARIQLIGHRAVRASLWINLFGIVALLVAVAGNYGPQRDLSFFAGLFALTGLLGLALWPLGLLVSLGNLVWACIRWMRTGQPKVISSR